jgi:flagellar motor switch protein FliN/FliY
MATVDDVKVDLSVVLGSAIMPIHQLLRMGRGAVIELDQTESDDVLILANDLPVARGSIVVNGGRIGVEVKSLLKRSPEAAR